MVQACRLSVATVLLLFYCAGAFCGCRVCVGTLPGLIPRLGELFTARSCGVWRCQPCKVVLKAAGVLDWAKADPGDVATVDGVFDYVAKHALYGD